MAREDYPEIKFEVRITPEDWGAHDVTYFREGKSGEMLEAGTGFIDKKHPLTKGVVDCPNCGLQPRQLDSRLGICTHCGWQSFYSREYGLI